MTPKVTELERGYYFSPGFYQDFWNRHVLARLTTEQIFSNPMKRYREVWIGSLMAAAQTSLTGIPHFVGLPDTEPPDIRIARFTPGQTPSGRNATKFEKMDLEITWCAFDRGEKLYDQIQNKNKPENKGMSLLVYVSGGGGPVNYQDLANQLESETVYLADIAVIGTIERAGKIHLPDGSFAVTGVYGQQTQDVFNQNDRKAFFRHPEVMVKGMLGVATELESMGNLVLVTPNFR